MANKSIVPIRAIRFCLGALVVIAFLCGLFAAGLAIYADTQGITFAQAWNILWHLGKNSAASQLISFVSMPSVF